MEKTKVAIIGSREFTNKRKIQEFVFKLKEKYKGEVIINCFRWCSSMKVISMLKDLS